MSQTAKKIIYYFFHVKNIIYRKKLFKVVKNSNLFVKSVIIKSAKFSCRKDVKWTIIKETTKIKVNP